MVTAGTTLTLDLVGATGGYLPIDVTDLRSRVIDALTPNFHILGVTIVKGSVLSNILDFQWWHWEYTATVVLRTRVPYGDSDHVRAIVAGVFYNAGGSMPSVTIRNYGETQGPGTVSTGSDIIGDLSSALTGTGLILVVGIVGIAWLIAYGPNIGSVARAVRP